MVTVKLREGNFLKVTQPSNGGARLKNGAFLVTINNILLRILNANLSDMLQVY
jgi:hypothetical protein